MGGSAARGGSTSGDAGESAGGDATTLSGEGNLPGTGGVGPKGGSSAIGGEQGDNGAGNTGTGGDSGTGGGGGSSGRGTGGASSGAGGTAGSTAGAGTGGGAGTAGSGGASTGSTGCNKAPGIPANMYNNGSHIDIAAAGLQRRYVLSVPSSYDNTHPYRLVIAFHWIGSIDDDIYANDYYHLRPLANDSAIFVAPAGQMNGNGCTTASNCSWPNSSNTDLALVDAIVAELEESFCVDKSRIFVTGFSIGSSMAYKTACERALGTTNGYVRAAAVYSGQQLSGSCTPSSPVAYYGSHGVSDSTIPYSQGLSLAQNFSSANGCSWATPTAATSGNPHVCTTVSGCDTDYPVKFCSFYGTHTADPLDPQQSTSWEYQATWDFLKQF
jgi:poly(3-hydroxybutyrate) depolymerase